MKTDVVLANLADEPYLGAGLGQGLGPLPPVGNRSFPNVTSEWTLFLRNQGLCPVDVSATASLVYSNQVSVIS